MRGCSVEKFLKPLVGGLIEQEKQAKVMLDELIPGVKERKHETKQGFYELMRSVNTLRETIHSKQSPKYTPEYFMDEWGMR